MSRRKRIAFIVNFITPYRTSFYQKLYSHQEYEWMFYHGVKLKEDGRTAYQGELSFPNQTVGYQEGRIGSFDVRWQTNLLGSLQKWQPDLVITLGIPSMLTNWVAMWWAHHKGIKTLTWYCGWESQTGNHLNLAIKQWFLRRYMGLADQVINYSTKAGRYIGSLGTAADKLTVCYNGLEIDNLLVRENDYLIQGRALREKYHLDGKKIFLYVGGMIAEKQVPLLLDAFQSIDKTEKAALWLIGDGPDMASTKRWAEKLHLRNTRFWGRVIENVDVFFAAADYFVLPGIGGLALNQALFWRVPCIVSEADTTEDDLIFEGRTGFRFEPNNVHSLEAALLRSMELPEPERIALGEEGRRLVVQRSNVNEMVRTFKATIDKLLSA